MRYDFNKRNKSKSRAHVVPVVTENQLEMHVKLQQSQEEFLAWLDEQAKQGDGDEYFYKKIR